MFNDKQMEKQFAKLDFNVMETLSACKWVHYYDRPYMNRMALKPQTHFTLIQFMIWFIENDAGKHILTSYCLWGVFLTKKERDIERQGERER